LYADFEYYKEDKDINIKINTEKQIRIRYKLTGSTIRLTGANAPWPPCTCRCRQVFGKLDACRI